MPCGQFDERRGGKVVLAVVGFSIDSILSLRWPGSKNKQGFLSLAPFTRRVMRLGPAMGAFGALQQV